MHFCIGMVWLSLLRLRLRRLRLSVRILTVDDGLGVLLDWCAGRNS